MRFVCLLLVLCGLARAAILRVPEDFAGIQAAFDASQDGDTVFVARGTWTGLLQSPVHSLLLCSNYLFSGDSTDINETILDGAYAGTVLTVNTAEEALLTVVGFTLSHGMSFHAGAAYCGTGGAVRMEGDVNACFTDIVFSNNRGENGASVIHQGTVCSGLQATGDLTMQRIFCVGNTSDDPESADSKHLIIRSRRSRLIIDGFRYDGGGTNTKVMSVLCSRMDTTALTNISVFNCDNSYMEIGLSVERITTMLLQNVSLSGCKLYSQFSHFDVDSSFVRVSNVNVTSGLEVSTNEKSLRLWPALSTIIADNIKVHDIRNSGNGNIAEIGSLTTEGTLHNFQFFNNVLGDSAAVLPNHQIGPMVRLNRVDLVDAHIHDNRIIIPADPDIGQTQGNYLYDGGIVTLRDGNHRVENVLFENNRIDDLDDYSNPTPGRAPIPNYAREFAAYCDTLRVNNVIVRNSRQPNHCPELYVADAIELSRPGGVLSLSGNRLEVENLLLEDCDDGGAYLWADTLLMDQVVIRNVGRMGLSFYDHYYPAARPYYRFRNVLIDNVDAADNWLGPNWQHLSQQTALFVGVVGRGPGWPYVYPNLDLQNVTIAGCDGMRHLFNFYEPVTLHMRNCLLHNNTYDQLVEWDDPITQDWSYNFLEEAVPGEGNLVGQDPLFDAQLGVPFLTPQSPCIDAGNPAFDYNDPEDPANPGFPLWPSLGNLRCDMGYTGGPHAALLDTTWSAVPSWEPRLQPGDFTLGAPYPNPFNPVTHIPYTLTRPLPVKLTVHNLLGQQVAVLVNSIKPAGTHQVALEGSRLASGIYLVTLQVAGRAETRSVTLVR
jgi:hypothetical protein